MTRHTVNFDREAASDLTAIRDYLSQARGRAFATAFAERIVTYCESFAAHPYRGTKRDAIKPGLRTISWRRTVSIAFEIIDDPPVVNILGVFYRGRDVQAVMKARHPPG